MALKRSPQCVQHRASTLIASLHLGQTFSARVQLGVSRVSIKVGYNIHSTTRHHLYADGYNRGVLKRLRDFFDRPRNPAPSRSRLCVRIRSVIRLQIEPEPVITWPLLRGMAAYFLCPRGSQSN